MVREDALTRSAKLTFRVSKAKGHWQFKCLLLKRKEIDLNDPSSDKRISEGLAASHSGNR